MFIKPIIKPLLPFDATSEYVFNFSCNGTDQFSKVNYIIESNADDSFLRNSLVSTYQTKFTLAANILTNGVEYRVKVRVGDGATWGEFSNYVVFTCLAPATVTITNFVSSNIINNRSVLLTGTFSQPNGDTVASYKFIIYDDSETIIDAQQDVFDTSISYLANGFESGKDYYVELVCYSQAGITTSSGLIDVTASYLQPVLHSVLELNNTDDGKVKITAVLTQVRGVANEYTSFYPVGSPEWLDVTNPNGLFYINEGLNTLESDFTLQIWIAAIAENTTLVKIYGQGGTITVGYADDCFYAVKKIGSVSSMYKSDTFVLSQDDIMLGIVSENGRINLTAEVCISDS